MRARFPARGASIGVCVVLLTMLLAPISHADRFVDTGWDHANGRVDDPVTGRLFVAVRGGVQAYNHAGQLIDEGSFPGEAFNLYGSMAVWDGTVYVSARSIDGDVVAMFRASDLTSLGFLEGPKDVGAFAVVNGMMVTSSGGGLSAFPLSDPTDLTSYPASAGEIPYQGSFASHPSDLDTLVAFDTVGWVYVYDVDANGISLATSRQWADAWITDAAIPPTDGVAYVSFRTDQSSLVRELRATDLAILDTYPGVAGYDVVAVAVTDDNSHVALASGDNASAARVFAHGAATPTRTMTLTDTCGGRSFIQRGLSFSPNEMSLHALTSMERSFMATFDDPTNGAVANSSMSLDATPTQLAPGDAFQLQGDLDMTGTQSGRTIELWRSASSGTELLANLTTGAGGLFSYAADATLLDSCFTARFQGVAGVAGTHAIAVLDVQRIPTQVTLDPLADTTLAPGEPVHLTGKVDVAEDVDQAGRPLTIRRDRLDASGTYDAEWAVTAGPGGTFTIDDTPPTDGTYHYIAIAPETVRYGEGYENSGAIDVDKLASTVSLTASRRTIDFGDRVALTATIPSDAPNQSVSIYERVGRESEVLVYDGPTVNGQVTLNRRPSLNASYRAVYTGDALYVGGSARRSVGVRAVVDATLLRSRGTSGGYALYKPGGPIPLKVHVTPDRTGRRVDISIEIRIRGAWRSVSSKLFRLRDGSRIIVVFGGPGLTRGLRLRFIAEYSERDLVVGQSEFLYARIT